jgi:reactive intermediate/imine deaminase
MNYIYLNNIADQEYRQTVGFTPGQVKMVILRSWAESICRKDESSMRNDRMLLPVLLISWLVGSVSVHAQTKQTDKGATKKMSSQDSFQLLIPETMPKSVGYSQVAVATGGKIVFIAGQVAMDKSGNVVGRDDFRAQVQQVFENLKAAVEAAGGDFNDVIKLNSYFLDFSHLQEFREVRDKYINLKSPPASTAVQVSKLFRPEFLVEIEAVAVVRKK